MNQTTRLSSEDVIKKIEIQYLSQVVNPKLIQALPRNVALSDFDQDQLSYLYYLLTHQDQLFVHLEFLHIENKTTHSFLAEHVNHDLSPYLNLYRLKAIHFVHEPARTWLSNAFEQEVEILSETISPVSPKRWLYCAVALSFLSALLLLTLNFENAKAWEFGIFTVGVLAFGYVWESVKAILRSRKHQHKHEIIQTQLTNALESFSKELLLID